MARRTGLDTLFDNGAVPTADELMLAADEAELEALMGAPALPLDIEDEAQFEEGVPGEGYEDLESAGGMSDEDFDAAIAKGIESAENYIDTELSPDRELAARYYRAEPFGNEEEDRSAVVMSEVRDTVLAVMPGLLRIFCGTTDAVEFLNNEGTPQEQAQAQTAYVNHIIHKDNDGFMVYYSAFKDALVRKTGIFEWSHEEKETVTEEHHTGLNEKAFALLQMEKEEASDEDENISYVVDVLDKRPDTTAENEEPDLLGPDDPMAMVNEPQNFIYDVRVRRIFIKKRHRVNAVPPEEFILSPSTSSDLDEYQLVGRRMRKTIGELVALGHDEEAIREAIGGQGSGGVSLDNPEALDRNPAALERLFDTGFENVDPASEYVKYCVVYVLIDRDGDGILERRKVCTVGDHNKVIYDEMVDEMVPYSTICPDPEPHSPFGYSLADQTMDFQEIKSELVRGVLDSLAESIHGRTAIVEGQVNIDDALSNARDQLVRIKTPGAIQQLSKPFNGMNTMPVLEYFDNMKARRTGITMSPSGLDPQALQSTSNDVAQATVDASQDRTEMIARIFAETGVKRMFRGLLRNVVKHQDQKRMIRLRGRAITVDPRAFNADLDLETNVGLGRGTAAKRMAGLTMIFAQQKEVLQTYGPDNGLVTLTHISNTVEDMVRENGFNDVSRYMTVMTPEREEQLKAERAAQTPEPTPEQLLADVQREKTQADLQKSMEQERTKRAKLLADEDFRRDELDQKFYTEAARIMGQFGVQVSEQELRERMEAQRDVDKLIETTAPQPQGGNGGQ